MSDLTGQARPGVQSDGVREPGPPAAGVDHHLGGGEGDAGVHDEPEDGLYQAERGERRQWEGGPRQQGGGEQGLPGKLSEQNQSETNVRLTRERPESSHRY